MNKYLVAVTYELVIFADDENQAAIIAQDGCLSSSVAHPQTGDVVHASIHIEGDAEQQILQRCDHKSTASLGGYCSECGEPKPFRTS